MNSGNPVLDPEITQFLHNVSAGDQRAAAQLVPVLYQELRRMARNYMRKERSDHTLQGTALVNEVYLALYNKPQVAWENREHFFRFASQVMRHLLVDHARQKSTQKRGGDVAHSSLDQAETDFMEHCAQQIYGASGVDTMMRVELDFLLLDQSLEELKKRNDRQAQVVEMKFYGGLGIEEIAEILDTSPATVKRDWTVAKMFLRAQVEANRQA